MTDNQEFFTAVILHLRKQGHRAMGPSLDGTSEVCKYRAPNGDKCAIGCRIPDEVHNEGMESLAVFALEDQFPVVTPLMPNSTNLAPLLQKLHDTAHNWENSGGFSEDGLEVIDDIARRFILIVPPMEA